MQEARLIVVRGSYLYALDPRSDRTLPDFGEGGRMDLVLPSARRFNWSSGPIVVNDVVVVGGTLDGAGDSGMTWRGSAPEDVRVYDVRSGRLLWTFHVVPQDGEFGADTWGNDSGGDSGDLGSWCCLSADQELGYVYVPLTDEAQLRTGQPPPTPPASLRSDRGALSLGMGWPLRSD